MFERYAIFYTPTGPLATFGAAWLGWDSATGSALSHLTLADFDVAQITARPRKYGFHATLKAPFRLRAGTDASDLRDAATAFAATLAPVAAGHLALRHDGGFVALRPVAQTATLQDFAATVVRHFDHLRAPLTAHEIGRRRKAGLTSRQETHLRDWGYPYIFEDFHVHLTLTGQLQAAQAAQLIATLGPVLAPLIAQPLEIDAITVMGQDQAGMFHQIARHPLTGL